MASTEEFPDVSFAAEDGLLALGGDLSPERLLAAYKKGIFPWYNPGEPILWWSPHPRCVIFPGSYKPSRSLLKSIRKQNFRFSIDNEFESVIKKCAAPRSAQSGTWITRDMMEAYIRLHVLGHAHSVETWKDGRLAGGLYGISLGGAFFGESMFSMITDASKAALYFLVANLIKWDYRIIDCQITSAHLLSLGAEEIPRTDFVRRLNTAVAMPANSQSWHEKHVDKKLASLLRNSL